jgi:hypothetical protein
MGWLKPNQWNEFNQSNQYNVYSTLTPKIDPFFVNYLRVATLEAIAHFDIKKIMPYYWPSMLKGVESKLL